MLGADTGAWEMKFLETLFNKITHRYVCVFLYGIYADKAKYWTFFANNPRIYSAAILSIIVALVIFVWNKEGEK